MPNESYERSAREVIQNILTWFRTTDYAFRDIARAGDLSETVLRRYVNDPDYDPRATTLVRLGRARDRLVTLEKKEKEDV